jgi:hypothetical protein
MTAEGEHEGKAQPPGEEARAEERGEEGSAHPQRSVFSSLPRSRPGVRSPRRAGAAEATAEPSPPSTAPRERPAAARTADTRRAKPPPASPRAPREPEAESAPAGGEGGGIEDLAWAGITVAAEAATLGVKLMSRAIEAVSRAAERR